MNESTVRPISPTYNNECCSPTNYDHKKSSLANSQIGRFNVVKQSRPTQIQYQ